MEVTDIFYVQSMLCKKKKKKCENRERKNACSLHTFGVVWVTKRLALPILDREFPGFEYHKSLSSAHD